MIEILLRKELIARTGKKVFMEQPDIKPDEYIIIQRLGGNEENHIGGSSFAFQSYAGSLNKAAVLNDLVIEKVKSLIDLDEISKVKYNTHYPFNDLATKQYRYQAVFDIYHY